MTYATNNNVKLFYQVHGSGEPLIMLMGLGGNSDAWALQYPEFSQYFQCIGPDNRGAGRSDMPDEPYSMPMFTHDVAAVMDTCGVDSAHIIGASMGGLIAQEFYHQYPDRVKSLVLACTGVGAGDPEYIWPEQHVLDVLTMERSSNSDREFVEQYITVFYDADYIANTPGLVDFLITRRDAMPQPVYANQRQLAACVDHPANSPRLKDIKVPTLVLHGERDQMWPLANAHYLADHIPNAQLKILPACAHMFFVECPETFNQAILDFLLPLRNA